MIQILCPLRVLCGSKQRLVMDKNELTGQIIRGAMTVHTALGPGLLESAYEACLAYELRNMGLHLEQQAPLPVQYGTVAIDCGYRLDLLVEDTVIVELKAVETMLPIHHAQLLSYLRLAHKEIGLLINFHELHLRDGIVRKICTIEPQRNTEAKR